MSSNPLMDLRLKGLTGPRVRLVEDGVEYRIVVSVLFRRCKDEDEAMTGENDDWSNQVMLSRRYVLPDICREIEKISQRATTFGRQSPCPLLVAASIKRLTP